MKPTLLFLVCSAILLSGCRPQLADQRDLRLAVGEILAIPIDPVDHEQTIQVTASSPGAAIHVHIYLKENEEAIERKITLGKPPEDLLASKSEATEISLSATVPAGKEVVVRLQSANSKTAEVHLEITN